MKVEEGSKETAFLIPEISKETVDPEASELIKNPSSTCIVLEVQVQINVLSSPVEAIFLKFLLPKAQLFPAKVGFGIVISLGRVIRIFPPTGIGLVGTTVNV